MCRARLPQIYKNYCDKSCEGEPRFHGSLNFDLPNSILGLSLLFFILSLMGNLTYGAGVSLMLLYSMELPD